MFSGLLCGLLVLSGCRTVQVDPVAMQDVHLSPLTTFIHAPRADGNTELKIVVELLDTQGVSMQQPCTLRFELYEFTPLSSQPRGRRLVLWPDISLKSAAENDRYWKAYLEGYEFVLPLNFIPHKNKYVLEVTCMFEQYRYTDIRVIEF